MTEQKKGLGLQSWGVIVVAVIPVLYLLGYLVWEFDLRSLDRSINNNSLVFSGPIGDSYWVIHGWIFC